MDKKPKELSWDRSQLTLRLPAARMARLRGLANELGSDATPTEAIVRAIDMATDLLGSAAHAARLDAVEDELSEMTAQHRLDADRLEAAMLAIAKNLSALHTLISEVSSEARDDF